MSESISVLRQGFRRAIEGFLQERLDGKLGKLADDDPKREELTSQFKPEAWFADAARRAGQIQAVTHTLKPIHPDARGSSVYRPPSTLESHKEIGSHSFGVAFAEDIVGNAAALDVYKFLKLDVDGKSLLAWMQGGNADLAAALNSDQAVADHWIEAFVGITRPRSAMPASHERAKQVYWLTGHDARSDAQYHLLAPLYASSMAHAVFQTINTDRFGEASKEARQARRDNKEHPTGFSEYPHLAVQKLGGTKPQNISQLNSERGGNNYLLASLPPSWKSRTIRRPWHIDSVFARYFGRRPDVHEQVDRLRDFLLSKPPANVHTRRRVDRALDGLIGELVMMAAELQAGLTAGWSLDTACELVEVECLWLDPGRTEVDDDFYRQWQQMDWPDEIGKRFGNWLNAALGPDLPLGDAEQRQWRRELLGDEDEFGWAWHLYEQRKQPDKRNDNAITGDAA